VIDPRPAGTHSIIFNGNVDDKKKNKNGNLEFLNGKKVLHSATETNWFENMFRTVTYKKDKDGKDILKNGKKEVDKIDDRCPI
jgi:hypothetical protein